MQQGTSAHSTLKCCDTQVPLVGGFTAIFIINTFFTALEGLYNSVVFDDECL